MGIHPGTTLHLGSALPLEWTTLLSLPFLWWPGTCAICPDIAIPVE